MIKQFKVGGFDDNFSYIVASDSSMEVFIVDPCGNTEVVLDFILENNYNLKGILITHSHFDHVEGIPDVLLNKKVPVYIHKNAEGKLSKEFDVHYIVEGDVLKIGKIDIEVLHTPGHIDDAVCFYIKAGINDETSAIITGDTLFVEGCGRTNQEGVEALYQSLLRLKGLDEKTKVYSGHDYGTIQISTISHEKKNNRFFLAKDFNDFKKERLG